MKSLNDKLAEMPLEQQLRIANMALEEMGKLYEWQDIESAPKDGTWVCLYQEGFGVQLGAWLKGSSSEGWNYTESPTHWMPLPEPPA